MQDDVLTKLPPRPPAEVCKEFELELEPEVEALVQEELTHSELLRRLIEGGQHTAAVRYLAHALPKREAVWWACLCIRGTLLDTLKPEVLAVLEAAEAWARQPSDEKRRAAQAAVDAAGMDSPAAMAAMAAFFSGGSLVPTDLPEVPPAANLTGRMVTGAVALTAVAREPEKAAERYRAFLSKGIELAMGGQRKAPTAKPQA